MLEGLKHFGFHRGEWTDPVTGLDNGVRNAVETTGKSHLFSQIVRQLTSECERIAYGRVLLAHPNLDVSVVRNELNGRRVIELIGENIADIRKSETESLKLALEMYGDGRG
jgi:hypothetical protein